MLANSFVSPIFAHTRHLSAVPWIGVCHPLRTHLTVLRFLRQPKARAVGVVANEVVAASEIFSLSQPEWKLERRLTDLPYGIVCQLLPLSLQVRDSARGLALYRRNNVRLEQHDDLKPH